MANEIRFIQRSGNGPLVERSITPAAGSTLGFDTNGHISQSGGSASVQAMTAAGAVSLTTESTTVASSGAIALTLADGVSNQDKYITMITDGGDATLTPAHMRGGTTITFNDVGDSVHLKYLASKWSVVGNVGATIA